MWNIFEVFAVASKSRKYLTHTVPDSEKRQVYATGMAPELTV